ncbi:putative Mast/stem cell growth factor receptor kita [Hypsibius exemplaris]|uniref:Mast/stem cell growth factor receptor kita n=1 Tax=Hypsibius exemplaris TaxID=2072580 RepID=A0A1W0WQ30_HYPEX|nr:putative Mast/stem cell growth factor receptor kita [Hypsibius exemplaris]
MIVSDLINDLPFWQTPLTCINVLLIPMSCLLVASYSADTNVVFRDDFNGQEVDYSAWTVHRPFEQNWFTLKHNRLDVDSRRRRKNFLGYTTGNVRVETAVNFTMGSTRWFGQIQAGHALSVALVFSHPYKRCQSDCRWTVEPQLQVRPVIGPFANVSRLIIGFGNEYKETLQSREFSASSNLSIVCHMNARLAFRMTPSQHGLNVTAFIEEYAFSTVDHVVVSGTDYLVTRPRHAANGTDIVQGSDYLFLMPGMQGRKPPNRIAVKPARPLERDFLDGYLNLTNWISASPLLSNNESGNLFNVSIGGGLLRISGDRAPVEDMYIEEIYVHSALKFNFTYGNVTWRTRMPQGKGVFTNLALMQMDCNSTSQCADELKSEGFAFSRRRNVAQVYSVSPWNNTVFVGYEKEMDYVFQKDLFSDFHLFTLKWRPDCLVWYLDGEELRREERLKEVPDGPMTIVMQISFSPEGRLMRYETDFLTDYIEVTQEPQDRSRTAYTTGGAVTGALALGLTVTFVILYLEAINFLQSVSDTRVLGRGQFAIVYQGTLFPGNKSESTVVAVKEAIDRAENIADLEKRLFEEVRQFSEVGRHMNVVHFLGLVKVPGSVPLLVFELCSDGSLESYLRRHQRTEFYNHVSEDGVLLPYDKQTAATLWADNRSIKTRDKSAKGQRNVQTDFLLSTADLLSFAYQVSRGMEYLAARAIIHRDLAARNVLVAQRTVVKISDFGMARQGLSVYIPFNKHVKVPLRWMPPESISSLTFTQKSDVWSYGVLLWEMFSLGAVPYNNLDACVMESPSAFGDWLQKGNRLGKPEFSPAIMFEMMGRCWRLDDRERPSFNELTDETAALLLLGSADTSAKLEETYRLFEDHNKGVAHRGLSESPSIDSATTTDRDSTES